MSEQIPDKTSLRSAAAKANGQYSGLINQRRGRKSIEIQDEVVKLAAKYPGYTINQLSWIAAGFHVDAKGICQPSDKYQQIQKYFNAKRRGAEIAFKSDDLTNHPKAQLVYVKAVNNPYTDAGGLGVRVIDGSSPLSFSSSKPAPVAETEPTAPVQPVFHAEPKEAPAPPAPPPTAAKSAKKHIGNMMDLLND